MLVIGADSGVTEELIIEGETGNIYSLGDAEELAVCILKAITNITKSQIKAKKAQKGTCQKFSKEKKAREIIDVYEELLGQKFE